MEHGWHDLERRKQKYSKKNLSHFVCHKSRMHRPGIERLLRDERPVTTIWSHGTASKAEFHLNKTRINI